MIEEILTERKWIMLWYPVFLLICVKLIGINIVYEHKVELTQPVRHEHRVNSFPDVCIKHEAGYGWK